MDIGRDKGQLTIHPAGEGTSLFWHPRREGQGFVAEMIARKSGIINYWWKTRTTRMREKIVVFNHYPAWDWIIASGSYLDEFNGEAKEAGRSMLWLAIGLIPLLSRCSSGCHLATGSRARQKRSASLSRSPPATSRRRRREIERRGRCAAG